MTSISVDRNETALEIRLQARLSKEGPDVLPSHTVKNAPQHVVTEKQSLLDKATTLGLSTKNLYKVIFKEKN